MADVARFPPLPPIPDPPAAAPDPRQETFHRIIGPIAGPLADGGQIRASNTTSGYRASAVDLGSLQELLGSAIARFDMAQLRDRWNEDVFTWMRCAVFLWVQRCKLLRMTLEDNGIRISLQTQDDRGYYHYEFDVFPGVRA